MHRLRMIGAALGLAAVLMGASAPGHADPIADFYRGKTMSLTVGYSVGGGYDTYARIVARHMSKHMPGNPTIVVQNMPGAGSLKAANYLYNVAPKDGTAFGIFGRGMAMEPLIGTSSAAQFDATKFLWLGSGTDEAAVVVIWHAKAIATWADMLAKPFTVGGEGSGSDPDVYALMLKNVFGVKLRLVTGYPGTAEIALALERGEVDGLCGWDWSSVKSQKADWVRDKKLNVLVQVSLDPEPELTKNGVPSIWKFEPKEDDRKVAELVVSQQVFMRSFVAPPATPAEQIGILRTAFDATMADPAFLADAEKMKLSITPLSGAKVQDVVAKLYATPKDLVERAKNVIKP